MIDRHALRCAALGVWCWIRRGLLVVPLLQGLVEPAFAAASDRQVTLNIVAGTPLVDALLLVTTKADMSLSINSVHFAGMRACELKGTLTVHSALSQLLDPLGINYNIDKILVQVSNPSRAAVKATGSAGQCAYSPAKRHSKHKPPKDKATVTVSDDASMSEVTIVTDTHLGSHSLAGNTVTLWQADLVLAGFQTVGEALRSLSQNFAAQNPGAIFAGRQSTLSQSGASSANLHGMGSSSTLTLLNGQPLATHETSAAVDLDQIPISAVERIDVVTGGASAVYGSDAVAGTVNIILRTDYQGLEVSSTVGQAYNGGGFLQHYSALSDRAWESGNASVDVDCLAQNEIDSTQRSFVPASISGTTLLPETRRCSIVLTGTQDLSDQISTLWAGYYTRRENDTAENLNASSPGVTAQTQSQVSQYATLLTLKSLLGDDWTGFLTLNASADDAWNPEVLYLNGNPFQPEADRIDNRLDSIEFSARGALVRIPSGILQLAAGAVYEQENQQIGGSTASTLTPIYPLTLDLQRRTRSVFAELNVPLLPFSAASDDTEADNILALSIAGRTSWYSDVGVTTNPRVSVRYTPTEGFELGGSWGTAYRAPSMIQLYNPSQVTLKPVPDPAVLGDSSLSLFEFGGNPQLRPEKSQDYTLDLTYIPERLPYLVLNATAFFINDHKRIQYPTTDTGNPLSDLNTSSFVRRNPTLPQIEQALAQAQFVNVVGGSYSPYDATLIINDHYENIARMQATGVDLQVAYSWKVGAGKLQTTVQGSYEDLRLQVTPPNPMLDLSGTVFNPPVWRARSGINWSDGRELAAIFVNYTGPSRNTEVVPVEPIASWMTVDATISYLVSGKGLLANTRFTLSAQNLLNRRPPFASVVQQGVANPTYDSTNSSGVGRFLMLGVVKTLTR